MFPNELQDETMSLIIFFYKNLLNTDDFDNPQTNFSFTKNNIYIKPEVSKHICVYKYIIKNNVQRCFRTINTIKK